MSIADWDPKARDGRPGLPQSEKESDHVESGHAESDNTGSENSESEDSEAIESEPVEADRLVGKSAGGAHDSVAMNGSAEKPEHPMHRLAAVRRQQGISLRNMARRLNSDMSSVLHQEQESSDLSLSELYQWQRALEVPVADLLVDSDAPLSAPVMTRARMVKIMKTAVALTEKLHTNPQRRLITMLMEQLLEIMPELREVAAWHSVGQRRTLDEFGRAVERTLPDELLRRAR